MSFNPNDHMMKLKGKDYLQVMWRLVWFREEHPDYGLDTVLLEADTTHAVFTAKITDETGRTLCSGHGSESQKDFGDFLEKAETKAVGRALAMLGYGTQFAADELDEGERIVDSPVDLNAHRRAPVASDASLLCEGCGDMITPRMFKGKLYSAEEISQNSQNAYGLPLCWECAQKRRKNESAT